MPSLPNRLLIDAVQRASMRAAADERIRLKRGLGSLATIAATAPLFGFLGTVIGIINSFPGCGGEKSICLAAVERLLSEALMPIVLGLAAAILALCFYKYLTGELETLDLEMQNTAVDLANHLVTHGSFTFLDELISPDCVIVK